MGDDIVMIYHDAARELADVWIGPGGGAIGGNWQVWPDMASAEAWLAEMLSRGYTRGHYWPPRY